MRAVLIIFSITAVQRYAIIVRYRLFFLIAFTYIYFQYRYSGQRDAILLAVRWSGRVTVRRMMRRSPRAYLAHPLGSLSPPSNAIARVVISASRPLGEARESLIV